MSARTRLFLPLLTIAIVAGVGAVEASRIGEVVLLGLLVVIGVLAVGIAVSLRFSAPVMVRGDLAAWLDTTSALTGETASNLANRAVSNYRAAMSDDRPG